MKRFFPVLFLTFLLISAISCRGEAAPGWLDSGVFPENESIPAPNDAPFWGAWYSIDGTWLREAADPSGPAGKRFFADVNGGWFVFEESAGDVPVSCDPPEWYPWQDTPEKRGLLPKGKDESLEIKQNRTFSWGDWENHFGGWFRRINPPGPPLLGAAHLVDENGGCFVLVVYPGATPRTVERFSWFPGFPQGWGIKPGTTVLVNKAAE